MEHDIRNLIENENFENRYRELLKYRLTYATLKIEEEDNLDLASVKEAFKIDAQLNAINYAFSYNENEYSHVKFLRYICEIEKFITNGEFSDFRKLQADVIGSNVQRAKPSEIPMELIRLQDDYEYRISVYRKHLIENDNISNEELDNELFNILADYHIRFLRIHPFGDGNGRCARVLLTKALYENNKAPAIVTPETKTKYCSFIENYDVEGMQKFLKELSNFEYDNIMIPIYNQEKEKLGKTK